MGMLNNYGQGAQSFADNFMKTYLGLQQNQRAQQEQAMMEKYRQAQEAMMQEQMAAAQQKRQQEAAEISGQMNLRGQVNMPGLMQSGIVDPVTRSSDPVAMKQIAQGQTPQGLQLSEPTTMQRVMEQVKTNPTEGLKSLIALSGQESNKEVRDALQTFRDKQFEATTGFKEKELELKSTDLERRQKQLEETARHNQILEGLKSATGAGKSFGDKLDYESGKKLISTLPKMKDEAVVAAVSLDKMKYMVDLMDKGAGGTAGALKAAVAPYAELFGYNPKSLSDAQAFQLAAKTISGSMRMAIIGPGQVSNYEQQLLQSLSGGGNTARAAAKELYALYAKEAKDRVSKYNDSVSALHELSPKSKTLWTRIEMKDEPAGKTVTRTGKLNGKTVIQYSDGTTEVK
jgi:hypothetical protein